MKYSEVVISFGPSDHPSTILFSRNFPFIVKIPIGRYNVAKTLVDNGSSLNLMMRKMYLEMGLPLEALQPVAQPFHDIIPGASAISLGRIDLTVVCGTRRNKRREVLTFEVADFDIGYNCILGRPFLLKFVAIIHSAYALMKMPGPVGVISVRSELRDAIQCDMDALALAGQFRKEVAERAITKIAKPLGTTVAGVRAKKTPLTTLPAPNPPPPMEDTKKVGVQAQDSKAVPLDDEGLNKT